MFGSKKISLFFVYALFFSSITFSFSDFEDSYQKTRGPGWKYYTIKSLFLAASSAASFYGGMLDDNKGSLLFDEQESSLNPYDYMGIFFSLIASVQPFLFREKLTFLDRAKNKHFRAGALMNGISAIGDLSLCFLFSSAGNQFKNASLEFGGDKGAVKNDALAFSFLGVLLRISCGILNEYGASLMEETKGMKVNVRCSDRFSKYMQGQCPDCGHEDNLKAFMSEDKKKGK